MQLISLQAKRFAKHQSAILLAVLLGLALALRLWGIGFGLPNLYHPDEDAVIMPAINIIKTGALEPTRMEYGTLHIYVLAAVSAAVFLLSSRSGHIVETSQLSIFERGSYPAVFAHPEYILAGRVISAFMGTGTVLLVYMLARRLGNNRQALLAAAIAAFLPRLVTHAHFATTDMPVTFWVTLGLYLLVRAYDNWREDDLWAYAGAGLICGLATSAKYNGIILLGPLLLVPLLRARTLDELLRVRVIVGPLSMLVGFLAGTPYALLNIPEFLRWFGYSLSLYNAPRELATPSWQWHLQFHLSSIHAYIFIFGLIGFFLSFRIWRRRALVVNSFALLLWAGIVTQTNQQARMWLPSAPIFILWATLLVDLGVTWLRERLPPGWPRQSILVVPLLIVIPLLVASIGLDLRFQRAEVRTMTQQWIEDNVPPGTQIAVDYFAPNLDTAIWQVTKMFHIYDQEVSWYEDQGIEYLFMSEAITSPDELTGTAREQYDNLVEGTCLVNTLRGPFLSNPEQRVWVYQLPPCE